MAGREKPDYVTRLENTNRRASFIKGHWYLYEDVPGGQPHRYLGRITETGLRPKKGRLSDHQKSSEPAPVTLNPLNVTVYEYGFSKAILDLCPDSWKETVGKRWRDVLIEIISAQSPHSYLNLERDTSKPRVHLGTKRLLLQSQLPVRIEEVWNILGNIYWIQSDEYNGYSSLSSRQTFFCQEHHIQLEVMS